MKVAALCAAYHSTMLTTVGVDALRSGNKTPATRPWHGAEVVHVPSQSSRVEPSRRRWQLVTTVPRGSQEAQRSPRMHAARSFRRYAHCVPDSELMPTHVLTTDAVRWAIDTLGAQRLHPTFVMYLYLRTQQRAGKLADASASSDELLALIKMPGNATKPYYFPLIDRGKRTGKPLPTFWRAENIPGSWSPGSIRRQQGGGWLGADESAYAWPNDHIALALDQMLYKTPVSALAVGAYLLRNDGFVLSGDPGPDDVIAGFRTKFDYPDDAQAEFTTLFTTDPPTEISFAWFEPAGPVINPLASEGTSDA